MFDPDPVTENSAEKSGTRLVLRPTNFYENAKDIDGLLAHVEAFQSRYKEITAPTIIFHGDEDKSVDVNIHSIEGMSKDVKHAELRVFEGMGHMPTHLIPDEIAAAIRSMVD